MMQSTKSSIQRNKIQLKQIQFNQKPNQNKTQRGTSRNEDNKKEVSLALTRPAPCFASACVERQRRQHPRKSLESRFASFLCLRNSLGEIVRNLNTYPQRALDCRSLCSPILFRLLQKPLGTTRCSRLVASVFPQDSGPFVDEPDRRCRCCFLKECSPSIWRGVVASVFGRYTGLHTNPDPFCVGWSVGSFELN